MPDNQWAVARRDLTSILSSDGGRKFWKLDGAGAFEAEFVDAELAKGAKPYDMLSR